MAQTTYHQPIAVIGMACRYPGASSLVELWENILSRRQQFRTMPDVRLPSAEYFSADVSADDKTYGQRAAVLDGFNFDHKAFRIPKSSFESTDIVHWLALATGLQAFEDAGLVAEKLPLEHTGVILGNTLTGEETRSGTLRLRWPFVRKAFRQAAVSQGLGSNETLALEQTFERLFKSAFPPITEDSLAGGLSNTIAGRICNYLDLKGGGYVVDGACASSLLAIATAADYLNQNRMDVVLAGGVDISLDPFELIGFAKATALSPDEMRVYDARGNGFIPGEGCGMVVLKRLPDAQRDGNRIYAVLRGWGISSDGRGGITAPSSNGQANALMRAYRSAGYSPQSLDFIEGHGTGTALGDRIELEGIGKALAQFGKHPEHSIGITSFKSLVGHTKAAAGIGGFIKTVIALNRRVLPPTVGCQFPHPSFADTAKSLYPITEGQVYRPKAQLRAGVSAMGFGGINCHVTLESGDVPSLALAPSLSETELLASFQDTEVFVLTAHDINGLTHKIQQLQVDAQGISCAELVDLASHYVHELPEQAVWRAALVVHSPANLLDKLRQLTLRLKQAHLNPGEIWRGPQIWLSHQAIAPRIGFLFPGQGSQQINMANSLIRRFSWAQEFVDSSERIFEIQWENELKQNLSHYWLRPVQRDPAGVFHQQWQQELTRTEVAQPAICGASWLWFQRLRQIGIYPSAVAGHSLGELTALAAASCYSPQRLMQLAALRGLSMANAQIKGAMLALNCDLDTAQQLINSISEYCVVANINAPKQIVLSGTESAIQQLILAAQAQAINAIELPVSNAFHSELMADAAQHIAVDDSIPSKLQLPLHPVYSGITGQLLTNDLNLPAYLAQQMLESVNFSAVLQNMSEHCDWFIEVGPGRVLSGLVAQYAGLSCHPVESRAGQDQDFNTIVAEAFVRGVTIDWIALYQNRLVRPFVPARNRQFYVNPCERPLSAEIQTAPTETSTADPEYLADSTIDVRGIVLKLITERTGFDRSTINDDARLMDDLNLDSIKIGSLIADAALHCQVAGRVNPHQLMANTVGQLIATLKEAIETTIPDSAYLNDSIKSQWIRAFQRVWSLSDDAAYPVPTQSAIQQTLLIAASGVSDFAEQLTSTLSTRLCTDIPQQLGPIDSLIILLEENGNLATIDQQVQQLGLIQRFSQQHPEIWKGLHNISFLHRHTPEADCITVDAFAASLQQDFPELEVLFVDFAHTLDSQWLANSLFNEQRSVPRFVHVRYDQLGKRHLPQLRPIELAETHPRQIDWHSEDVVLVTGGGKGITAQCALALAQDTGVKLALLGRTRQSYGTDPELQQTVQQLEASGVNFAYFATDVSDLDALRDSLDLIEQQLGPISGVVHGAGLNHPHRCTEVNAQQALQEIAPKLSGLQHLFTLLESKPLKMFAVLTSIIGISGMRNNAWYAYANQTAAQQLAKYAHNHPEIAVVAYAYSVWDEVGMGVKLGSLQHLQQIGIQPIAPAEGIRHFLRWLHYSAPSTEIVISGPTRYPEIAIDQDTPLTGHFLGQIVTEYPGIERITQVDLSTVTDPYLIDHNFRGSLLMPTVMGLEAMAQNAIALLQRYDLEVVSIQEIKLERPIVVTPEQSLPLKIHALVNERESLDEPCSVQAALYTAAGQNPHFSARFVFGRLSSQRPAQPISTEYPLDIAPQRDLYGSILFQGPLFQRIRSLYYLDQQQVIFTGQVEQSNQPWQLGDPYYRDALLQSAQLAITPDVALPVAIDRIDLFLGHHEPGYRLAQTRITEHNAPRVTGTVEIVNQHGELVERIYGYHAQIIDRNQQLLSPKQLIDRAQNINDLSLQPTLDQLAKDFGFDAPIAVLQKICGLSQRDRESRRQLELPAIRIALNLAEQRLGSTAQAIQIDWQANGKPVVIGNTPANNAALRPRVSLSHDGDWLLCIAGIGQHGCDLASVIEPSEAQWRALFSPALFACVQQAMQHGDALNRAGTRIWAVVEAAFKAASHRDVSLSLIKAQQHTLLWQVEVADHNLRILSLPISLSGQDFLVAVTLNDPLKEDIAPIRQTSLWSEWLSEGGNTADFFSVHAEFGQEPGSRYLRFRFPLTFKEAANPDGTLYFARLPEWMGRLREIALRPIQQQLTTEFTSGEFAWVTNHSWLQIVRPVQAGEVLEVTCRFIERGGPQHATIKLAFDWFKLDDQGIGQNVAYSQIEMTWAKVIGHGLVSPHPYPEYLDAFFQEFSGQPQQSPIEHRQQAHQQLGEMVWQSPPGFEQDQLLSTQMIMTSLNDANLVGNLYYAKYYELQGLLRDHYVQGIYPEAYRIPPKSGGLRCRYCHVQHLRDAMPFEQIEVQMLLRAVHQYGVVLSFEYYRHDAKHNLQKLAVAEQVAIWSELQPETGEWRKMEVPMVLLDTLMQQIQSTTT